MGWLSTYSEVIQGIGSIVAVVVSLVFSVITCCQNNKQLAKAQEELQQSKFQTEREAAKKVSAWYAGGADQKNKNLKGMILSNSSDTPIYNVCFQKTRGGAMKSIALLPPGMWFFEENDKSYLMTDKWNDPVQLTQELNSPSRYCFWEMDGTKIPIKTVLEFSESDVTLYFRDNNGRNWENRNGKLIN